MQLCVHKGCEQSYNGKVSVAAFFFILRALGTTLWLELGKSVLSVY